MKTFAKQLDTAVNLKVSQSNQDIQPALVSAMADKIRKERMAIMEKAMDKERSLLGMYHKTHGEKPATKATFAKDGETIVTPAGYSAEQIKAMKDSKKNLETLTAAMVDCATLEFVAPVREDESLTDAEYEVIYTAAQDKFVKDDIARWKTLNGLVNKK